VPKALKADIDAMAKDTGILTSQGVRLHLEADVKQWKGRNKKELKREL